MKFVPYKNRIWFDPIKQESMFASEEGILVAAGKVLGVGTDVTFVKEGDTVFFLHYGAEQTPEMEGETHWTVLDDPRFILGKYEV